ncbi:hypothetical protein ACSEE7_07705 [Halomonas cupida]|uniref:hypothetical protein n=1 Tax=Halomonas cupida TaxID=44933 RepID=UPI003EF9D8C9
MSPRAWTEEEEQKLREMYEEFTPVPVIAALLKRSRASIEGKAAGLGIRDVERRQFNRAHPLRSDPWHQYRKGRHARDQKEGCHAPPNLSPHLVAWFKAGWHDRDIELGHSVIAEGAA